MTVLATDPFTRANSPNLGGNWTVVDAALPIVSNQVGKPATTANEYYNGVVWPNDHYSQIVIKVLGDVSDEGMGPVARMQAGGNMYLCQTNTTETRLYKRVSGTYTQLGTDGPACSANDVLRVEAQGTSITVKRNGTTIIGPVTDAAITTGNAGLWGTSSAATAQAGDDWEGGDFSGGGGSVAPRTPIHIVGGRQRRRRNPARPRPRVTLLAALLPGSTTGTVSDTLTAADSNTAAVAFVGARAEALTAADTPTATATFIGADAEALTAADASTGALAASGALAETLSAADAETGTLAAQSTAAESLTAADSETGQFAAQGLRSESLSAADAQDATVSAAGSSSLAEILTATDAETATATFSAATSESVTAADSETGALVAPVARAESLTASDSSSATIVVQGAVAEALTVIDSRTASAIVIGLLNDILAAFDAESATGGQSIVHLDEPLSIDFTSLARAIDFDVYAKRIGFLDGGTLVFELTITQGEIEPISMVLQGADPDTGVLEPYDVSGAATLKINAGKPGLPLIISARDLTKVSGGTDGHVTFTPVALETSFPGRYDALVVATFSGGVIRKFPGKLTIKDAIA